MVQQSIRLALRKLIRYPGATLVAMVTLAVSIAVAATIFTVAWAILVRPFPFADQERLVQLWGSDATAEIPKLELSYEEVTGLRKHMQTLEGVAPFSAANQTFVAKRRDQPMDFTVNSVGVDFFRTLGVQAFMGRTFRPEEHKTGAPPVVMLSYKAWRDRFGSDPKIVGSKLGFGETGIPIVGVLPRYFELPNGAEVIGTLEPDWGTDANSQATTVLSAVAKIKPGKTLEDVQAELRVVKGQITRADPTNHVYGDLIAYPLVDEILGSTKAAVHIMFGMGLLVLVIALLNTACVALAQGVARADELAIRSSVGASRAATAAGLFVEFAVLALTGAVAGVAMAHFLLSALLRIAPSTIPRLDEVHIGLSTVLFAAGAAIVAAALASFMQLAGGNETELLRSLRAGTKSTVGRKTRRMLELLAAGQVAVAILTIVVAIQLIQSFQRYLATDVGFTKRGVVTFHLPRGYLMTPEPEKHHAFFEQLLGKLRNLPGVEAAGAVLMRPLEIEQGWDFAHCVEGQDAAQQSRNALANFLSVTPGYFEAMSIKPVAGRLFRESDDGKLKVTVVSESFARRYWKQPTDALGKRVKSGKPDSKAPWITIVGVVKDVRYRSINMQKLDFYEPLKQTKWSPNYFAVRTSQDPNALIPAIRDAVREMDKDLPVAAIRTTEQLVDKQIAQPRLSAAIVSIFAVTASLLALVGLYGVLTYVVRRRTRELGVRMALGATSRGLAKLVTQRAMLISLAGTAAGITLSLFTDRLWRSFVHGAQGTDPRWTLVAAIAFAIAALVACLLPALRASRIDPAAALRAE